MSTNGHHPSTPWWIRAAKILSGVVVFLFFAGGIGELVRLLGHFIPGSRHFGGISSLVATLIALGAVYVLMRDELEAQAETKRQRDLYRWEVEQLKDAAGAAIRTNSTALLVGTLKDIAIIEGKADCP